MPAVSYGFDLADANNWTLVKGFSSLRHFQRETDNDYQGGHLNFDLKMTDNLGLEFGISKREYKFKTNQGQRLSQEAQNPTLAELGVTSADLGRVYDFGDGLDLPAGSPTAFFAPNIDAFREIIGFDCGCLNQVWRLESGVSVEPRQPVLGQRIRHELLRPAQFRLRDRSVTVCSATPVSATRIRGSGRLDTRRAPRRRDRARS